jgi:hypothetical protein
VSIIEQAPADPGTASRTGAAAVSVDLRGGDAVLTLRGCLGPDAVRAAEAVLGTLVTGAVRHVIVDLSAAHGVPVDLREALDSASWALQRRRGWLLVEGDADPRWDDAEDDPQDAAALLDAFHAYRSAVAPPG